MSAWDEIGLVGKKNKELLDGGVMSPRISTLLLLHIVPLLLPQTVASPEWNHIPPGNTAGNILGSITQDVILTRFLKLTTSQRISEEPKTKRKKNNNNPERQEVTRTKCWRETNWAAPGFTQQDGIAVMFNVTDVLLAEGGAVIHLASQVRSRCAERRSTET